LSRTEQHCAFGFLIYYLIYILWTGTYILNKYLIFLIVFFSIVPDLDSIYYYIKLKGKIELNMKFQHHYTSFMHYPLVYVPFIIAFVISLIFDFFPLYFLIPVVGIYIGHFLFDTIACGDGIMWCKNPFKKDRYARFINLCCSKTDGYHGKYWNARYQQTFICKIGNIVVIISVIIIQILEIFEAYQKNFPNYTSAFYLGPIVFIILMFYLGIHEISPKWLEEPQEGRYADYRIDPKYINGLSEKNRKKHLEKYFHLLNKKI